MTQRPFKERCPAGGEPPNRKRTLESLRAKVHSLEDDVQMMKMLLHQSDADKRNLEENCAMLTEKKPLKSRPRLSARQLNWRQETEQQASIERHVLWQ